MCAKKVGGKLRLHLLTANGGEPPIDAVSGIIKQPVQAIIGQGDDLRSGAFNALRVVEVQQNTGQPELLHPRHVIRFTAGGQDVKALAF